MALAHLLAPITFVIKSMNPSIVKPKPRGFKAKGNANRAIKVEMRFFQLISEEEKAGFPSLNPFLKLGRAKFTIEKNQERSCEKKGGPIPGLKEFPGRPSAKRQTSPRQKTERRDCFSDLF
jgi:hypothetical protein